MIKTDDEDVNDHSIKLHCTEPLCDILSAANPSARITGHLVQQGFEYIRV